MSFLRKFGETVRFITGSLTEEERKQELKRITHRDDLSFYEGTIREVEDKREPNWTSETIEEVKRMFKKTCDDGYIGNDRTSEVSMFDPLDPFSDPLGIFSHHDE